MDGPLNIHKSPHFGYANLGNEVNSVAAHSINLIKSRFLEVLLVRQADGELKNLSYWRLQTIFSELYIYFHLHILNFVI